MLGNKQKGTHVGYIRVQSSNEDTIAKALDVLRPLGVELLTSETIDEEELILFYLSRMNNKLDNLGQLRHLVKLERVLSEHKQREDKKAAKEREREDVLYRVKVRYVAETITREGFDPHLTSHDIRHLTLDEIKFIFAWRLRID